MDLQLLIPILALAVAGYSAHLQRQQVNLMTAGQNVLPGIPAGQSWWKSPTVIALFILVLLTWVPWLWTTFVSPKFQPYVTIVSWGALNLPAGQLQITAAVTATKENEKLEAIAFHYKGDVDVMDAKDLQKSAMYDVRAGIQILVIHIDDKFTGEILSGMRNTSYILLIVPSSLRPEDFSTLREAFARGAILVGGSVGPP
jgi:hypothetical protein